MSVKINTENQLGTISHEDWMQRALRLASQAFSDDEVPIGCVIIHNNKIIGQGYNQCESLNDATAHAEMIAITAACSTLDDWRLNECSINSRIGKLYFGCYDKEFGACGSKFEVCGNSNFTTPSIIKGNILGADASALLQQYFIKKRKEK